MKIDIVKYTVSDLFGEEQKIIHNDERLVIPRYQREFDWDKQINQLWDDLSSSFKRHPDDTDFWGTVLINKKNNNLYIVDGQQRLITLFLLVYHFNNGNLTHNGIPIVFSNQATNTLLQKLLKKDPTKIWTNSVEKKTHLYKAFKNTQCLVSKVSNPTEIYDFLLRTTIAVVELDSDIEATLLFGRLNNRGLGLTSVDLIKYRIFSSISSHSGPQKNDETLRDWNELVSNLYDLNIQINSFIDSWFLYKFKNSYIEALKVKSMYTFFEETYKTNDEIKGFLVSISKDIKKIKYTLDLHTNRKNDIARDTIYLLQFSQHREILSLILKTTLDTVNKKNSYNLINIVTMFEFITLIMTPTSSDQPDNSLSTDSNLNSQFELINTSYLKYVLSNNNDISDIKRSIENLLPDVSDFQIKFSQLRYTKHRQRSYDVSKENMESKYAIYSLANYLETVPNPNDGLSHRRIDDDQYSIEHIISESKKSDDHFSLKIGNLVVLEQNINNFLGNKNLKDKIKFYKKHSKYQQMKQLLTKSQRKSKHWGNWAIDDFDENIISIRGDALAVEFLSMIRNELS
ncbi:MAG: DUF262 domain-containing protein [Enterococcus faecalis]